MDNNPKIVKARLSFPRLFTPESFAPGQDKKFQASFLLDPNNPAHAKQIEQLATTVRAVAEDKWKDKAEDYVLFGGKKCCMGYGNKLDKIYDGYKDMVYIRTSEGKRPVVVDRDKTPLVEEDGKPYAGCYVNAGISFWAQDNQYGKRINANLRWVQFAGDGDAFGAPGVDVDNEIDALDDDEEDIWGDSQEEYNQAHVDSYLD